VGNIKQDHGSGLPGRKQDAISKNKKMKQIVDTDLGSFFTNSVMHFLTSASE
jgi:hypothetical protein